MDDKDHKRLQNMVELSGGHVLALCYLMPKLDRVLYLFVNLKEFYKKNLVNTRVPISCVEPSSYKLNETCSSS